MKTITEILNEMILKNEKEIKRIEKIVEENAIESMDNQLLNIKIFNEKENKINKIIEKIEKTILILSISIILNTISIIILNLWR